MSPGLVDVRPIERMGAGGSFGGEIGVVGLAGGGTVDPAWGSHGTLEIGTGRRWSVAAQGGWSYPHYGGIEGRIGPRARPRLGPRGGLLFGGGLGAGGIPGVPLAWVAPDLEAGVGLRKGVVRPGFVLRAAVTIPTWVGELSTGPWLYLSPEATLQLRVSDDASLSIGLAGSWGRSLEVANFPPWWETTFRIGLSWRAAAPSEEGTGAESVRWLR